MTNRTISRLPAIVHGAGLTLITIPNTAIVGYLGLISAAGARRATPAIDRASPRTSFAILVPAHNEEAIVADALEAFRQLDYEPNMFDVHVVADNCSDRTAQIVCASGWTVHERFAADDPGKGPALNWLFDRLDRDQHQYDVAAIVDADTVVDPGFLRAMDRAFQDGAIAAQGFYAVRDPGSSSSAGLRYAALACRHHLRPLGRCRLGASSGLYGNGMAFDWTILRRRRWTGHLTEDAEFQMELLVHDSVIVTYVPDARVEAEMPHTFGDASGQNERWEHGRIQLAKHYLPALVGGFRRAPVNRRVAYADAIADHLVPPLSVLAILQIVALVGDAGAAIRSRSARRRLMINVATTTVMAAHLAVALRSVDAPSSVYRSLLQIPRMVAWKARMWVGALKPTHEITWQRTRRNAESLVM